MGNKINLNCHFFFLFFFFFLGRRCWIYFIKKILFLSHNLRFILVFSNNSSIRDVSLPFVFSFFFFFVMAMINQQSCCCCFLYWWKHFYCCCCCCKYSIKNKHKYLLKQRRRTHVLEDMQWNRNEDYKNQLV